MIHAFGLTSNPRKAQPPAVDDVSFEACAGDVTVLLGGAGAGKTTALRLMLELQQGRGITYFRGRPLHRIAHPAREVGVLLGDVPGHPARSVRGHLRMLCAASGVPARRADEVLEAVGLVSLREERLGTLSRGMDRRLGLACALLPDPHTLVLDEPTDGLSAREAQWVHDMLRAHARQGGTVLLTSADPKEAARTADRVVTLDGGRLVADQDAREFGRTRLRPRVAVRSPHAARLAALLAKEARTGRRSVEVVHEGGNRLSVYGSTTADIGEAAFRHGILIHQLAGEVGDMGPGAGARRDALASGEPGGTAKESAVERDRTATPGSSPAEPEPAVPGLPTGESASSGAGMEPGGGAGLGVVLSGEADAEVAKKPAVARDQAAVPGFSPVEPEPIMSGLPMGESETAVCDLPTVKPGASGVGVSASASNTSAPGLSATGPGGSTLGSVAPEQATAVSGLASAEPGVTAPGASARERDTMPFGFSVDNRENPTADTALPRTVPSCSPGEEPSAAEELPSGQGERVLGGEAASPGQASDGCSGEEPSAEERAQALSSEAPSLGEASDSRPDTERTETSRPAPAGGASPTDSVTETSGSAPGGAEPDGVDAPGGVDGPIGDTARDESTSDGVPSGDENAPDGDDGLLGQGAPGRGGAGAVPAEALARAGGSRTEAATTAGTRQDATSAAQVPQTGGTNTPARALTALRARLPGARNPSNRQPHFLPPARPDNGSALDALPPLPPPICVRPAPSPLRPLRYEIRRATGIGVGFLTCGAVLVVSALTAVLLARLGHTPQARLFGAWPRELPLPPAALAAGLLGALAFGDEFRHPALAADRGTVPRRLGLLTAKLLVSGATAVLLAFLTVGCDAEALYLVYGRELTQVPADWLSLSASWFGLVLGCAWAGVLAAGVFRSTTGGLAAVLAVPVVVVPLVHEVTRGPAPRVAAGFPVRMREVYLLQWPFGGERYLLGLARVLAQPVGSAMALSLAALLCAYLFTTLRTRFR
ncbi:ATP-binding cassette domain-containing protein [Streptomyces sp. NPDC001135]